MNELKTLSVVIIHQDMDEANRIASVLDNTGYVIHAHQVSSSDQLNRTLDDHPIELAISESNSNVVNPSNLLKVIKGHARDIPTLFIHPDYDAKTLINCLRLGGQDVIVADNDQHLISVVQRELRNLNDRKQRREMERRYNDTEKRCLDLLQDSKRATAIIHDSMLVYTNPAFAESLEYEASDLDCLPVFDVLTKPGQQSYKTLYKGFYENPEGFGEVDLELTLKTGTGEEIPANTELRHT